MGKGVASYDLKDMITGKAVYGIGNTHGRNAARTSRTLRCMAHGEIGRQQAALAVPGVKRTETLDAFKPPILFQAHGGVGVLATNSWAAIQAEKLKIEWTDSEHKSFSSDPYKAEL
jgi:isoquinoline 1-oxidoreductase beta subunit